ncbi:MAG: oxidoreductase [Gammaproteobacteria bacterium]|nr:MAG: oxidoreductase [Gammaproteobacteria bacterium]
MNEDIAVPTVEATIKNSTRITPDSCDEVRQMTLQIDDPAFRCFEGQSIGIVIPGPHPFGNKYHMRRYTVVDYRSAGADEISELSILVKRCFFFVYVNGEKYPGIASNYLCDASSGDKLTLTGPYKSPFKIPSNPSDNLLMIGTGTGIAPFRSFIQRIYKEKGGWQGEVRLFYGAKSGMELLYMNDINDDLANYYDEKTFQAFNGLASRPMMKDTDGLARSIEENGQEIWSLIQQPNTYIFLAGLKKTAKVFDLKISELAGSEEAWETLKKKLIGENRFSELLYS